MDNTIKVSVVIPTFNRKERISRAIESALSQSYRNVQVIVVDDGSTDNTAEVVDCYVKQDDRVRYIRVERNVGGGEARNIGIRASNNDFVAFLDSDDYWHKEKLERQIDIVYKNPDVDLVYTGYRKIKDREVLIWEPVVFSNYWLALLAGHAVATTSTLLVKRSRLIEIGGFDEKLPAFQDTDLLLRLSRRCVFECISDPLVTIDAKSGGGRISGNFTSKRKGLLAFYEKHKLEMLNYFQEERFLDRYISASLFHYRDRFLANDLLTLITKKYGWNFKRKILKLATMVPSYLLVPIVNVIKRLGRWRNKF